MHAAEEGHSTLGIPQKVGAEFVAADHGRSIKKLPVKKKPVPTFGALSPE